MGYKLEFETTDLRARSTRSSSTATHGTMWGGSSNHGEDYGIAW